MPRGPFAAGKRCWRDQISYPMKDIPMATAGRPTNPQCAPRNAMPSRSVARPVHSRFALPGMAAARSVVAACFLLAAAGVEARTINDDLPQVYTLTPTGVNLQSGGFMRSTEDFSIGPLKFVRSWGSVPSFTPNSIDTNDPQRFGVWNHNYGIGVEVGSQNQAIARVYFEGRRIQFRKSGDTWNTDDIDSRGSSLAQVNGNFVFTAKNGDVYSFTTHPALTPMSTFGGVQVASRVDHADGSRLDLSYDGSARLRTVISNRGYAIVLDYGANGRLASACGYNMGVTHVNSGSTCGGAALKASYGYTAASGGPLLSSVTDVAGKISTISYSSRQVSCITFPGTQTCDMTNIYGMLAGDFSPTSSDQVRRQISPTGEVWNYQYIPEDPDGGHLPAELKRSRAQMTDPVGNVTAAVYLGGYIEKLHTPAGATEYEFNGTVPAGFTPPEGNKILLWRDGRQNLVQRKHQPKWGSGTTQELVWSAAYPADRYDPPNNFLNLAGCDSASPKLCDKPVWTKDPNQNRTDFTYDPAHGGPLSVTGPAVNGVRAQTRSEYVQRYARILGPGGYQPAAAPVWLLSATSTCRTSAATGNPASPCATAGDEVRTAYDYGPDSGPSNLLVRSVAVTADGVTLRTCFGYDWLGRRISETKPALNAVCS